MKRELCKLSSLFLNEKRMVTQIVILPSLVALP